MKTNGQREDAEIMCERVFASSSYYEALGIITEYVDDESLCEDFEDDSEGYDESDEIMM